MKRYEYRTETLSFPGGPHRRGAEKNEEKFLEALNNFGQDGWRLKRIFGDTRNTIFKWSGSLNLLLERAVED